MHRTRYVATLREWTGDALLVRTREGDEEEVPPPQWPDVRWLGPAPDGFFRSDARPHKGQSPLSTPLE